MKLSTRSRYGVRLMLELALHYKKGYLLLRDIAEREEISEKYLGQIIIPLKGAGLVNSARGSNGGYALNKIPAEITVKDIVEILEGDICPVECIKKPDACSRISQCVTRNIWLRLNDAISKLLGSITLQDLVKDWNTSFKKGYIYQI